MIKQSELEVMVCDLFVDAYRAGQSCGDLAYNAARGTRASLIRKLGEVYAELEHESYEREQFETELKKANNELGQEKEHVQSLYSTIRKLQAEIQRLHEERYVMADENALNNLFKDSTPEDLPFPEVDLDERIKAQKSADRSVDNLHFIQDLNRQEREKGGDE